MSKVRALIASGYGINCEKEVAYACEVVGATATLIHAQALVTQNVPIQNYDLIIFPGGFSFGDELGAGKVFANRICHAKQSEGTHLREKLHDFIASGKCILGICNGFQLLVKLGIFSDQVSLAPNSGGQFQNRWVFHRVSPTSNVFTQGLTQLYLPIRHGEGRLLGEKRGLNVPMRYEHNPNGSMDAIAALSDSTGRVLGMMAHPEAALFFTQDPRWLREKEKFLRRGESLPKYGDGYAIFYNVINYLSR